MPFMAWPEFGDEQLGGCSYIHHTGMGAGSRFMLALG